MTDPRFVPVDLTMLQNEGVLMAVNERVLWPLGLALTWDHDEATGSATNLHVREWRYEDGHHEAIELEDVDAVADERRSRFAGWVGDRALTMPEAEREGAWIVRDWPDIP